MAKPAIEGGPCFRMTLENGKVGSIALFGARLSPKELEAAADELSIPVDRMRIKNPNAQLITITDHATALERVSEPNMTFILFPGAVSPEDGLRLTCALSDNSDLGAEGVLMEEVRSFNTPRGFRIYCETLGVMMMSDIRDLSVLSR